MSLLLSLMMHIKLLIDISSLFAPTEAQKFVHSFQFQAIVGDECLDNVRLLVHEDRANQFYVAIRKYYPGLKDGSLEPGYAGIRPKLFGPEEGPTDFVVQVTHQTYSKFQPEWSLKFRGRSISSLYCATLITCD
ncbi:hypothetical protein BC332_06680 [Capsicum chinense]|nr:hypothetical protein BC332_06680 [Capsicum chinense]